MRSIQHTESIMGRSDSLAFSSGQLRPQPLPGVVGKGSRRGTVALSTSLVGQLHAYTYTRVEPEQRFFPITRGRVHQIVTEAADLAGITIPDGVGRSTSCATPGPSPAWSRPATPRHSRTNCGTSRPK